MLFYTRKPKRNSNKIDINELKTSKEIKDFIDYELSESSFFVSLYENEILDIVGEFFSGAKAYIKIDISKSFIIKEFIIVDINGKNLIFNEFDKYNDHKILLISIIKTLQMINFDIINEEKSMQKVINTIIDSYIKTYIMNNMKNVSIDLYCSESQKRGYNIKKFIQYINTFEVINGISVIRFRNGLLIYDLKTCFQISYKNYDNLLLITSSTLLFNKALDILMTMSLKNSINEFNDILIETMLKLYNINFDDECLKYINIMDSNDGVVITYNNPTAPPVVIQINDDQKRMFLNEKEFNNEDILFIANVFNQVSKNFIENSDIKSPTLREILGNDLLPSFEEIINEAMKVIKKS